jgi:hypothetical protein
MRKEVRMLRSSSTSAIVGIVGALAAIDVVKECRVQAAFDYGSFGALLATRLMLWCNKYRYGASK